MEEHMLTTVDNPYNPFYQYDEWNAWDTGMGYYTASYLARVIVTADDLSDADENDALEQAIDEIIRENVFGVHIRVTANDVVPRIVTASAT